MSRLLLSLGLLGSCAGHGSLLYPVPRGGVDRDMPPFNTGGWPQGHYTCTCVNGNGNGNGRG